jgi:hypothetical protein
MLWKWFGSFKPFNMSEIPMVPKQHPADGDREKEPLIRVPILSARFGKSGTLRMLLIKSFVCFPAFELRTHLYEKAGNFVTSLFPKIISASSYRGIKKIS